MDKEVHSKSERFTTLCAPYSEMVYRHCLHVLRKPQEAEDAAQESMLRAFRAFDSFRGAGVATWLFRIAHNTCLDIVKSARYKREALTLDEWCETHGDPVDDTKTPEEAYEQAAANEELWQAVATLPRVQQVLLSLLYGQCMSYEELASATGLQMGTVKSKISRAKETLRKKIRHSQLD